MKTNSTAETLSCTLEAFEPLCEAGPLAPIAPESCSPEPHLPSERVPFRAAPDLRQVEAGVRVIHQGHSGPEVCWIQQILIESGASLELDGKFGPRTEAAVRAFQSIRGLRADGLVGARTLDALEAVAARGLAM